MNKLTHQRKIWIVLLSTILLCLFIFGTNPKQLSVPFLLIPPLLIFTVLYYLSQAVLQAFTDLTKHKRKIASATLASGPVLVLLLASLGQLTVRDTLLSLLLMSGLAVYFSRAGFEPTS